MAREKIIEEILTATDSLINGLGNTKFREPVKAVYNPLEYAGEQYLMYLKRYGGTEKRIVFLGMNPGPWGMAQTGVPFGEVDTVREWLGINGTVGKPAEEIPKRPVAGFACTRSEVSGRRVWGLMKERFGTPEAFFKDHLVLNYCPLLFYSAEGKNLTPDKLKKEDRTKLFVLCDEYLKTCIRAYGPVYLVGFGNFAAGRIRETLGAMDVWQKPEIVTVLHPSPANPRANRGWAEEAVRTLTAAGVW